MPKARSNHNAGGRRAFKSWVAPYLARHRLVLAAAIALGIIASAFSCALMITSGYLVSASAAEPDSILLLFIPLILVRIFGVGKPVISYVERLASHDWVLRMTSDLRRRLYLSLERASGTGAGGHRVGDVMGALSEDIGHLQNLYLRSIFPIIVGGALYLMAAVALGAIDPGMGLFFAAGCGVAAIIAPTVSLWTGADRERDRKRRKRDLYTELADNVMGIADWSCSGRRDDYLARHLDLQDRSLESERAARRFNRRRDLLVQASFGCVAFAILVWAAGRFGGQPAAASGAANWIAAFTLGFFPLTDEFSQLPGAAVEGAGHLAALEHLAAVASGADETPAKSETSMSAARDTEGARRVGDRPEIAVRGASFRYPGAPANALESVDLLVPFGQHVAILGRSGAGKSTLEALIHGDLSPLRGSVEIDGVPAGSLANEMPRILGVVHQNPYLFGTTLYDNLCVGRADATREEAMEALRKVGLSSMVDSLPHGIDQMVDEGGLRFSGGERHRIALARILLADTPVVMLDEPFAGLDPATESRLLCTLLDVFSDRTLIMVTHHLKGIERMDRVVFLEDGEVALDGAPASLERTSERYRDLIAFDRGI